MNTSTTWKPLEVQRDARGSLKITVSKIALKEWDLAKGEPTHT